MTNRRHFSSDAELHAVAGEQWAALNRDDWLEAFVAHPRIGDVEALRRKFASTAAWCASEQAGAANAANEVLHSLAEGNHAYEAKFGYIFIVCATGKTAEEMLAILRARLPNDPDTEIHLAAAEQAKITRLRLEKL
jgi:2-oxo-4-hydroxy-4-carboxy-5-ureidoimidazoline decarboxylase